MAASEGVATGTSSHVAPAATSEGRAGTPAGASNGACPGQVGWDAYTRDPELAVVTTTNVPIEMSDGVTLYADLARPDAPVPFPTPRPPTPRTCSAARSTTSCPAGTRC